MLLFIIVFAESPFTTKEDTIKGGFNFPRPGYDPSKWLWRNLYRIRRAHNPLSPQNVLI